MPLQSGEQVVFTVNTNNALADPIATFTTEEAAEEFKGLTINSMTKKRKVIAHEDTAYYRIDEDPVPTELIFDSATEAASFIVFVALAEAETAKGEVHFRHLNPNGVRAAFDLDLVEPEPADDMV